MTKFTLAVLLSVVAFCLPAFAQTGNKAAAEALFDAGKALMNEGKYSEACPKLVESQRLDPAPGTLLNLADCYEQAGLSASAWATWLEAAAAAKDAGQTKREELARQRANALKSRLVSITIQVPESARVPGLEITRDGTSVGLPMWGTSVPVDPGMHTIVAHAPQRRSWQTNVSVVDGVQPVQVTVPLLEKEAQDLGAVVVTPTPPQPVLSPVASTSNPATAVAPTAKAATAPQSASAQPVLTQPVSEKSTGSAGSAQRAIGYISLGIGAVGVTVGTIYGLQATSKNKDSTKECSSSTACNSRGIELRNEAFENARFSNIGFTVGIVGAVAGAVLLLTAPAANEARAGTNTKTLALHSLELVPSVGLSQSGLAVKGAF